MEYDELALRAACLKTAENALWNMKPFDATPIKNLTNAYLKIANSYLEDFDENRNPEIVVRAVYYLAQIAIPSGEDTTWFDHSLQVLLELSCPNITLDEESIEFLKDIETGIAESRLTY